jgi:hypothetical protein
LKNRRRDFLSPVTAIARKGSAMKKEKSANAEAAYRITKQRQKIRLLTNSEHLTPTRSQK